MQNYVVPLVGNMFPLLGKELVQSKLCAFTSEEYVSINEKNSFNRKNVLCFHYGKNKLTDKGMCFR